MLLFSISEAFTWTQEPDKPTKVIENGINNRNVRLAWEFALDSGEELVTVAIYKEDIEGGNLVQIVAWASSQSGFTYQNNFDRYYRAEHPAQLTIFNVDNVKEYKYILQVRFTRSGPLITKLSTVRVEVFGKWRLSLFRIQIKLPFFYSDA